MLKAIAVPEESAAVKKNKKMEQYWRSTDWSTTFIATAAAAEFRCSWIINQEFTTITIVTPTTGVQT
eukprot:scaffold4248_cov107-Skeletonema_marinoi.AAC.8